MILRHGVTVLLVGLYVALVGPAVATVLLAVRANGVTAELPFSVMLVPWAVLLAGPGALLLGLVFGWMLVAAATMGINGLLPRVGLALLVASVAWFLAEPLPDAAEGPGDWLVWAGSAAVTALVFTRRWVARRVAPAVVAVEE